MMINSNRQSGMGRVICLAAAAALLIPGAFADVTAKPQVIKVTSMADTFEIGLSGDSGPVPAGDIRGLKVMVDSHDYDHMFTYKARNGQIVIAPTDQLEIGTYDLVIDTAQGQTVVHAEAPLSDLEGTIEYEARELGVTPAQYREMMKIVNEPGTAFVDLHLPSVYYLGQTLEVEMNVADASRTYTWYVNGKAVESGQGPHTLAYTFQDIDSYFITYREFEGDEVIVEDSSVSRVVPEPSVLYQIGAKQETTFSAPPGYARYNWSVNGKPMHNGREFETSFAEPGEYTVTCDAHSQEGSSGEFRRITYRVTVT